MSQIRRVFITGGCGYVGSMLVQKLLSKGYDVTVLDLMIFGNKLLNNKNNLNIISGDIRETKILENNIPGHDAVIHLACISNDPSFELNPKLGKSINYDAFEPLVSISKNHGVKRFIYASSSSVYGVKKDASVHEDMALEPLTDYSKYKALCEDLLLKHCDEDFTPTVLRPATVCGLSLRQRLDVIVNILTNLAFHNRKISVFGGQQYRPNIHMEDMVQAYLTILEAETTKIKNEIFNVGNKNESVLEIANIVKRIVGNDVILEKTPTNDTRSYHISSKK